MPSQTEEYRPAKGMAIGGVAFLLGGVVCSFIGANHLMTGEPLMITHRRGFGPAPATQLELIAQVLVGLVFIGGGILWLMWCARGAILLEPEGVAVRNLFGRIVRRVRWEEVTGVKASNYQGRHYWIQTTGRSLRLQSYQNLDILASEVGRRSANIERVDLGD